MRQAFIDTLSSLAKEDKKIFLLNGDLGFSVLEKFNEAFPERSLNMGVAEANMVGVAAGLAMSGKKVFVYSIIPFVTSRVYEQIRDDVALQKANVKIVGVGSGFTYGQLGPTHHSILDIAIMRALPNMTVICPGDPFETEELTRALAGIDGPAYLRIGNKGEPKVHDKKVVLKIGKGVIVKDGNDCALFATGNMLTVALGVSKRLEDLGIKARVISMHTIKPLDKNIIVRATKETPAIFTVEEHSVIGGLGSAVAEVIAEGKEKVFFKRLGIKDIFTTISGTQDFLRNYHNLSIGKITRIVKKNISRL